MRSARRRVAPGARLRTRNGGVVSRMTTSPDDGLIVAMRSKRVFTHAVLPESTGNGRADGSVVGAEHHQRTTTLPVTPGTPRDARIAEEAMRDRRSERCRHRNAAGTRVASTEVPVRSHRVTGPGPKAAPSRMWSASRNRNTPPAVVRPQRRCVGERGEGESRRRSRNGRRRRWRVGCAPRRSRRAR